MDREEKKTARQQEREKLERVLMRFVVRATGEEATAEEVQALPAVAKILVEVLTRF